ncbi:hypothetical protein GGI42DRAFT_251839 [Trichoderma sp. SZMC 28013]
MCSCLLTYTRSSLSSTPVEYSDLSYKVCGAGDDAGSRTETWRILSIHHDDNELQNSRTCSAAAAAGLIHKGRAVTGHAMVIMSQETLGSTWRQVCVPQRHNSTNISGGGSTTRCMI